MTIEITIGELIERLERHDGDLYAVIAEEREQQEKEGLQ